MVKIEKKEFLPRIQWILDKGLCVYCGEVSEEIEHVVPRCSNLPTYTVKSCGECNRLASGVVVTGLRDKLELIRSKRKKKYRKLLSLPEWDEAEIKELAGSLQTHVRALVRSKEIVSAQLSWDPLLEEV